MTKLLKISGRTFGILTEWLLILIILFAFIIRTSAVQTYLAGLATDYLSSELEAEVKVDRVSIVFFDEVALDGVLIKDQKGDTLIFASTIFTEIDELNLQEKSYSVSGVKADKAYVHIQRYKDSTFNHSFLRDYFVKDKKKKNKIRFNISDAEIARSRFRYDDHRKIEKDYGVDYWHISANDINGKLSNLKIVKDVITASVHDFSLSEKSGFHLNDFSTQAEVSPRGVKLSNLNLTSRKSHVESDKFYMSSNGYDDFKYFVDSVTIDGSIKPSTVALDEIALFGYALRGMNDTINLSGKVSRKVKNLRLTDVELRFKHKTHIKGDFNLPDYRDFNKSFYREFVQYAFVNIDELESLRLPDRLDRKHLSFDPRVKRLKYFEAENFRFEGFIREFVVSSENINTILGSAKLDHGIKFTKNKKHNSYFFEKSLASQYDVKIEGFHLGNFLADNNLGVVDGVFFLSGEVKSISDVKFTEIRGDVTRFDYLGYPYEDITITEGSFIDDKFEGKIEVEDDNLDLTYDGFLDFNGDQHMHFSVDLTNAFLQELQLTELESKLSSKFIVDLKGRNSNEYKGNIKLEGFVFTSAGEEFEVPDLTLDIQRSDSIDIFEIESSIGKAEVKGKIDFEYLIDDFKYQLSRVFPSLYQESESKKIRRKHDNFEYDITVGDISALMAIFAPRVKISSGTTLSGRYYGESSNLFTKLNCKRLDIDNKKFTNITLNQLLDSNSMNATYLVDRFSYNDSLNFSDIVFKTSGRNDNLKSILTWEENTDKPSLISWTTDVHDIDHYQFVLDPSYFHIQKHRWDIAHESKVLWDNDTLIVEDFQLVRNQQSILVNGQVSNQESHRLNFEVNNFELSEIADFISEDYRIQGKINGWGFITNPFNDLYYVGDANLSEFKINDREVGHVFVQSNWNKANQSVFLTGDLVYKNIPTFKFHGDYFIKQKEDNLDIKLDFDNMDITFVNAFTNPEVLADVRGIVNGEVDLSGTPEAPILEGDVELQGGSTYIDFLGTHFAVDGPIEVDKYGFYLNSIPIFDEDGNAGSLIGSVYHDNFRDFNFDMQFDLEDDAINRDPINPWRPLKLDRFLVMNTPYSPDYTYYGKGYITGTANIFGYTDNLEITVNATSQEGTWLNIPMYGVGEIDEDNSFIHFKDDFDIIDSIIPKFDLTGVDLDLQINVTPEADVKIIFNEELDDAISANGSGSIYLGVDNFGHISMEGVYTVANGIYNFAMPIIKSMPAVRQNFYIEEGGTITWTRDPYDADLNLKTYYRTDANIADLSPDLGSTSGAYQDILCYLNLSESLLKPTINFDIQAPMADDISKSLIARVKSDQRELNKQFISLLLLKSFQPLSGTASADGSAALDLIASQINTVLAAVSSEYKMKLNLETDQLSGDNIYEFGVSKEFLNNRLILSGSFGYESKEIELEDGTNSIESSVIGDVYLEYILNEDGTFRINIFNESTDKTVIYDVETGIFTQGTGLSYKEEFNNASDFKMIQYFFDLFRKKGNKKYPIHKKKRQVPVDPNDQSMVLSKED